MNDKFQVAETILQALGGETFIASTKCQIRGMDEISISFGLPIKPRNKCNRLKVTLTPQDDYRVEFFSVRNGVNTSFARNMFDHVSRDKLRELFENETGLLTHK